MITPQKKYLILFTLIGLLSLYFACQLKFTFSIDQFFPEGDPELEFYRDFTNDFEADINFLMVAVKRKEGVFKQEFLRQFHDFTLKARTLPHIKKSQSLTTISYPLKTPFAITTIPAIHIDKPERYPKDKARILADERFLNSLITPNADALVVALSTTDSVMIKESQELITALNKLILNYSFEDYHVLGPAYFQKEMVDMQKREITVSAVVSSILVTLILFWIFRKPKGIAIAIISIGLGFLLFLGFLGLSGRELSAMAALYPVLMIIVGTSDVIHIMSKYIDELRKGLPKSAAIQVTIKEIGLATLLTSITTAVGFASLMTSKVIPIKEFGMNAAIGVIIAYISVIFFTTSLLILFDADQLIKSGKGQAFWGRLMDKMYWITKNNPNRIVFSTFLILALCLFGISKITTNYRIQSNLPNGEKITSDFQYFEKNFAGFRPLEIAVFAQGDYKANDYEVIMAVDQLEQYLRTHSSLGSINSMTTIYKSINQMQNNNRSAAYQMPKDKKKFAKYQKIVRKLPKSGTAVLLSKDQKKTRITSRILDMGADSIQQVSKSIDQWIAKNTDPNIATYKQTGTGLILDKNAEYVRRSLILGLGMAVLIVSLLMALLFQDWRMVIISLIPNIFPLLLAGALLGFLKIELDAGISIVFAVVFGIAVDDTIHFLSKYKLSRRKGMTIEQALYTTYLETGKAICLTTIVLFFGFLVLLFSIHPPSIHIGMLISLTLLSALASDLFLMPPLIRWLEKEEVLGSEEELKLNKNVLR